MHDADDTLPYLGDSLCALAGDHAQLPDVPFPDGTDLAALAAATPFVRRTSAVADRLDRVDVLEAAVAVRIAAEAADRRHIDGTFEHATAVSGWLLLIAGHRKLVDFAGGTEEVPLFGAGAERALLDVHPLAAWGEALVPVLLGDCDGGVLHFVSPGPLLGDALRFIAVRLFEVIAHAQRVVESDVIDALCAEIDRLGLRERYPGTFTRRRVQVDVAVVRALLVEMGLATWRPQPDRRRGEMELTPLGAFGYLIVKAEVDGVWPELEDFILDAGYVACDGGYIHSVDLPVPISLN